MFKFLPILSRQMISQKRFLISLLGISCVVLLIVYASYKPKTALHYTASKCYLPGLENSKDELEDMLRSNVAPTPGRTIFFHETSCHRPEEKHVYNLTARQACSIESAALHNPNFRVFVLFASYSILPRNNPIVKAILSYKNVYLRQVNIWDYVKDTPIQKWFTEGELFRSSYLEEHTLDLLRLLSLYRYGGIYLDLDVVVQRTMEFIPLNYFGTPDNKTLDNAVFGVTPLNPGHRFIEQLLHEILKRYNPTVHIGSGHYLVTPVLKSFCNVDGVDDMIGKNNSCGFKVYNSSTFYSIDSDHSSLFLDPKSTNDVMNQTKESYLLHFENKPDIAEPIRFKDGSGYAKLAQKNCPKTVAAAGEYF